MRRMRRGFGSTACEREVYALHNQVSDAVDRGLRAVHARDLSRARAAYQKAHPRLRALLDQVARCRAAGGLSDRDAVRVTLPLARRFEQLEAAVEG